MKLYLFILPLIFTSILSYSQPKVGELAPEIILPGMTGKLEKLSDLKGKLVLIDFWASWCGPCRSANPGLVRLYKKYKSHGFEIYGVSLDDNKAAWKKAVAKDKITWKQVNNSKGWEGSVSEIWRIEQIPTSFLLDKTGVIIGVDLPLKELEQQIASRLNHF